MNEKLLRTSGNHLGSFSKHLSLVVLLLLTAVSFAQTTITTGNTTQASAITAGNTVTINAGGTLNMDVSRNFASITTANAGTSNITGAGTLTTGAVTLNSGNGSSTNTLSIAAATTVICTSVVEGATGNANKIINLSGTLKNSGPFTNLDILTCNSGSLVEYTGTNQTVFATTYSNLTLSGTGTKTAAADITVGLALTLNIGSSGVLSTGANTLTLNGSVTRTAGTITTAAGTDLIFGTNAASLTLPNGLFTSAPSITGLTVNRTGGLILGDQGITLSGTLTLTNGVVTTGSNTLSIGNGAITRTNGWVNGNLLRNITSTGAKIFAIGDNDDYTPVTLTVASGTGTITVSSKQSISSAAGFATLSLQSAKSVDRVYTITKGTFTASGAYSMAFTYDAADLIGGATGSLLRMGGYNAGDWLYSAPSSAGQTLTTLSGIFSSGEYVFAEATPLTLTGITTATKVYNNSTAATLSFVSAALNGVLNSDAVGFNSASAVGTFADKNVGTGKTVNVSGVTLNGADSGAYILSAPTSTGDITAATLSFNANSATKVYGSANPALSGTVTGFVGGETQATATTGTLTFTTPATTSSNVGTYAINGGGLTANNGNYLFVQASANATAFSITPATLTYTANAATRPFGQANPAFSGTVTGFVSGQTQATATTGTLAFTTAAIQSSPVGAYAITGSGLTANNGNYTFVQAAGNSNAFIISKAGLVINASAQAKTYGATVSTSGVLNTTFTVSGLQGSDIASGATLSYSGSPAGNLAAASTGNYTITPSALVLSSGDTANYTLSYTTGTLTVNPASLTVTASGQTKSYGSVFTFGGTEFSTSGLVNGNTVTSATLTSTGSPATASVGNYSIVPSAAVGSGLSNYTISYVNGTLSVTPIALTITADNQTKCFGQTLTFAGTEFSSVGLVNSDSVASVMLTSIGANSGASAGNYAITPAAASGTGLTNYTISYVDGSLAVSATSVGGTLSSAQTICGGATPASLSLASYTGNVIRWESSVSPFTVWTPIVNTNDTYAPSALTQTTKYRAVVQSGVCSSANSSEVIITVNEVTFGSVSGSQVCVNSNADVTLDGLVANSTSLIAYNVNGGAQTPISITANGSGQGVFQVLIAGSGQTLEVTSVTRTDVTPSCPLTPISGNMLNFVLDSGCTQLLTCGVTLPMIDTYVSANSISGATAYRWRVTTLTGSTAGQVQLLSTPLRTFRLTQLGAYGFATQYKVEAAAFKSGVWAPYGIACNVTSPSPTSQLLACGQVLNSMNDVIYANSIAYATGYRFRISDPLNPLVFQEVVRPIRELRMNQITGFYVQYNKTYNVEVAIRNNDGTFLPYGTACPVTTPIFPTTSLIDEHCDDYAPASVNSQILAYSYVGAIGYAFQLTGPGLTPVTGAEVVKTVRSFKLADFTGLIAGETYNVKVRLIFSNTDAPGPYGKTCTVVVPLSSRTMETKEELSVMAYPNPFADHFTIDVKTESSEQMEVRIYDMTGRLIESHKADPSDMASLEIGSRFPSGIYNVIVTQGDSVKSLRMIRR